MSAPQRVLRIAPLTRAEIVDGARAQFFQKARRLREAHLARLAHDTPAARKAERHATRLFHAAFDALLDAVGVGRPT